MNDGDNEISKVSYSYTQKQISSDIYYLENSSRTFNFIFFLIYKVLDCSLKVIESCIINGLKLTLLNRIFLALFRTREGGHIPFSQ